MVVSFDAVGNRVIGGKVSFIVLGVLVPLKKTGDREGAVVLLNALGTRVNGSRVAFAVLGAKVAVIFEEVGAKEGDGEDGASVALSSFGANVADSLKLFEVIDGARVVFIEGKTEE
mmetsp:Transcript_21138/g.40160  ORF Transcript_21138/g.40160 Transcript_21138/m.40160 type:complete len:116 (+) Transcript_21138:254-601(+)